MSELCAPVPISGVVFLVPAHRRFLRRLVANLNTSHCPLAELVLIASGFTPGHRGITRDLSLLNQTTKVKIVWRDLLPLGNNRNAAIENASFDVTTFMDPDDLYSPRRNCDIARVFADDTVDVFCHGYFNDPVARNPVFEFPTGERLGLSKTYGSSSLVKRTLLEPPRDRDREIAGHRRPPNLLLDNAVDHFEIHHGHMSFRRQRIGDVRFDPHRPRGTDAIFLADLLERGNNFCVTSARLSLYLPNNSTLITPRKRLQRWVRRSRVIGMIRSRLRIRRRR